jgi:hypothetical protein
VVPHHPALRVRRRLVAQAEQRVDVRHEGRRFAGPDTDQQLPAGDEQFFAQFERFREIRLCTAARPGSTD